MVVALALGVFLTPQADSEYPIERLDCPKTVTVPMLKGQRRAPLIEVVISGKVYKFALDTGAVGGRVSKEIVDALGLRPVGKVRAGDPSGQNVREASIYEIPKMKLGGATLYGVRMMADDGVVPKDAPAFFDGVLGYGVFHDLLLTLDYPNSQVTLTPGSLSADQKRRSEPYKAEHGIPVLPIRIGSVLTEGHVDSGSDGGLSIPMKFKDQLNIDGEIRKIGQARTLFNTIDIYGAKVTDPISIGNTKVQLDFIELNDLFPIGNIGGRVLSKFKVTIDQKHNRILLES